MSDRRQTEDLSLSPKNMGSIYLHSERNISPTLFLKNTIRFFVMDRQNQKDVLRLAKSDSDRAKVSLFLEDDIVPDPYYDDELFEPVYQMVRQRCEELVEELSR